MRGILFSLSCTLAEMFLRYYVFTVFYSLINSFADMFFAQRTPYLCEGEGEDEDEGV
jgi:hypothetical protein